MKLYINASAHYSQTLTDEDIEMIKEDIKDGLIWTGIAHGSGVVVEVEAVRP
jgi:hypothetical protein